MSTPASPSQFSPASVQEALAATISTGSFADTAYYLFSRRTADGAVGRPTVVYASSRVMRAAAEHFDIQLGGRFSTDDRIPDSTADYGYEHDSDIDDAEECELACELDPAEVVVLGESSGSKGKSKASRDDGASDSAPGSADLRDDASRKGIAHTLYVPDVAAVTWHALVFFVYTGTIHFAPLRSNGLEARRAALEQHRGARPDLPALCSPKSMYRLADMVGLAPLKELAEKEIQRQLAHEGIAAELFSHFSATYPDVLNAQIRFVYDGGRMAQVMQALQRQVAVTVSGGAPHAESVLNVLLSSLSELLLKGPAYTPQARGSSKQPGKGPVVSGL
ncbi:hypothetical protein PsYK624_165040 [Phanerochaete sordida]|uniref:BTB domain-containing protein n=1 Tax=Phanerochaete sordida TaxID=48140 RepID=A0A9P3GSE1_9APHY|nr:hypothetical protein PsYK624_165040 [Phanerochaete sordida]